MFLYFTIGIITILNPNLFSGDWKTYSRDNSILPSNNILCIAIDDRGIKWFGTDKGLVQYDNKSWKLFLLESDQDLPVNNINDLVFESQGGNSLLWIATENGVSLLDITNANSPSFSDPYVTGNSGLINNEVKALTIDPGNVRWFGTFGGVSNFYNDIWSSYSTQNYWIDTDSVVSIASGPDSTVYIGTKGGGVSRLKLSSVDGITSASTLNTTWTGFYEPDSGKLTSNNVYSILIEDNGRQWFGTDEGVAIHTSYNTLQDWKNYTQQDGLINDFVQAICKENENVIWFGTQNGVSRFDGISWTNYTTSDGLASNNVFDIAIDHDGSIWFATENGITFLKNQTTAIAKTETIIFNDILISNYPNPFNLSTSIVLKLKNDADVKIDIYNCTWTTYFLFSQNNTCCWKPFL